MKGKRVFVNYKLQIISHGQNSDCKQGLWFIALYDPSFLLLIIGHRYCLLLLHSLGSYDGCPQSDHIPVFRTGMGLPKSQ